MGMFDKVGDFVGDVVDGVNDVIDDVFGVDLLKTLDNDWVKVGLMAASIFTGGVAIVNGVMTGYTQASTATGFMNTFVAGAEGFVKGAMAGLGSPLETAGDLAGQASSAVGNMTGTATTGTDMLAADLGGESSGLMDTINASGDAASKYGGSMPQAELTGVAGAEAAPAGMPGASNAATQNSLDLANFMEDPNGYGATLSGGGGDAMSSQLSQLSMPMEEEGILSKLAKGAGDFASSPMGMQTLAGAAQGWAQGKMIEERWDEMQKAEKQRRKSYEGFGDTAPRFDTPTLQELRARSKAIQNRGNQAQSKYGY